MKQPGANGFPPPDTTQDAGFDKQEFWRKQYEPSIETIAVQVQRMVQMIRDAQDHARRADTPEGANAVQQKLIARLSVIASGIMEKIKKEPGIVPYLLEIRGPESEVLHALVERMRGPASEQPSGSREDASSESPETEDAEIPIAPAGSSTDAPNPVSGREPDGSLTATGILAGAAGFAAGVAVGSTEEGIRDTPEGGEKTADVDGMVRTYVETRLELAQAQVELYRLQQQTDSLGGDEKARKENTRMQAQTRERIKGLQGVVGASEAELSAAAGGAGNRKKAADAFNAAFGAYMKDNPDFAELYAQQQEDKKKSSISGKPDADLLAGYRLQQLLYHGGNIESGRLGPIAQEIQAGAEQYIYAIAQDHGIGEDNFETWWWEALEADEPPGKKGKKRQKIMDAYIQRCVVLLEGNGLVQQYRQGEFVSLDQIRAATQRGIQEIVRHASGEPEDTKNAGPGAKILELELHAILDQSSWLKKPADQAQDAKKGKGLRALRNKFGQKFDEWNDWGNVTTIINKTTSALGITPPSEEQITRDLGGRKAPRTAAAAPRGSQDARHQKASDVVDAKFKKEARMLFEKNGDLGKKEIARLREVLEANRDNLEFWQGVIHLLKLDLENPNNAGLPLSSGQFWSLNDVVSVLRNFGYLDATRSYPYIKGEMAMGAVRQGEKEPDIIGPSTAENMRRRVQKGFDESENEFIQGVTINRPYGNGYEEGDAFRILHAFFSVHNDAFPPLWSPLREEEGSRDEGMQTQDLLMRQSEWLNQPELDAFMDVLRANTRTAKVARDGELGQRIDAWWTSFTGRVSDFYEQQEKLDRRRHRGMNFFGHVLGFASANNSACTVENVLKAFERIGIIKSVSRGNMIVENTYAPTPEMLDTIRGDESLMRSLHWFIRVSGLAETLPVASHV